MSLNYFPAIKRRRRGSTSPPLTNIESNPGPKGKKKSHKAHNPRVQHLTGREKFQIAQAARTSNATFHSTKIQRPSKESLKTCSTNQK